MVYLVQCGVLKPLCDLLDVKDAKVLTNWLFGVEIISLVSNEMTFVLQTVTVILDGLSNILGVSLLRVGLLEV